MNKYKQYRVVNNKGKHTEFSNGKEVSESLKESLNKLKPFVPHWIEYRFVDLFKIPRKPELVKPLEEGKKDSSLCCRRFYMKNSPSEIEDAYMKYNRWKGCINIVAQMLIHVSFEADSPLRIEQNGKQKSNFYTCKNLDRKTGGCSIYDNGRPEMCKMFPEAKEEFEMCDHCTTKDTCNGVKAYEEKLKRDENVKKKPDLIAIKQRKI